MWILCDVSSKYLSPYNIELPHLKVDTSDHIGQLLPVLIEAKVVEHRSDTCSESKIDNHGQVIIRARRDAPFQKDLAIGKSVSGCPILRSSPCPGVRYIPISKWPYCTTE